MVSNCTVCDSVVSVENSITCDLCHNVLHTTCSGLSRSEIQYMKTKNRKLSFYCSQCTDLKLQLSKMEELNKIVHSLQGEIQLLKEKLSSPGHSFEHRLAPEDTEKIIREVTERESRKSNLVLFNIPELNNSSKAEQTTSDVTTVNEILDSLNVPLTIQAATRLGKYDPTNLQLKRAIKVTLPQPSNVYDVLRNCKKLKNNEKYKAVTIIKDRTPQQSAYFKSIRQQLNSRMANGENGLSIKFINDIPTIVSSKTQGN